MRCTDGYTLRTRGCHALVRLLGQAAAYGTRPDAEGARQTGLVLPRHNKEDRVGPETTLAAACGDAGRAPVRARRRPRSVFAGRPRRPGAGHPGAVQRAGKGRRETQPAAL